MDMKTVMKDHPSNQVLALKKNQVTGYYGKYNSIWQQLTNQNKVFITQF